MQIDKHQRRSPWLLGYHVTIPDLFQQAPPPFGFHNAIANRPSHFLRSRRRALGPQVGSHLTARPAPSRSRGFTASASFTNPNVYSSIAPTGPDRPQRIGLILSGDIRSRSMHRLIQIPSKPPAKPTRSIPTEPARIPPTSLKISPNVFSVSITSKLRGFSTICIAALSTSMWLELNLRIPRGHLDHDLAPELRHFKHVRFIEMLVTFLRRFPASLNAVEA